MSNVASLEDRLPRVLEARKPWAPIALGVGLALILAALLVLNHRVADLKQALAAKASADELATTRYEAEMGALHEIKVKIDTLGAYYQEDVRLGLIERKDR